MKKLRSPHGISLLETLVAVAIVGTLATVILPTISAARSRADTAKCASNLRQLGVGILTYATENEGSLPPGATWDRSISPYLGIEDWNKVGVNTSVLLCPSDKRSRPLPSGKYPRSYTGSVIKAADQTQGVFGDGATVASRKLAGIPQPGSTIMLFENFTSGTGNTLDNEQFMGGFSWSSGFQTEASTPKLKNGKLYHQPVMNFLFVDGHVESLPPAKIYTPPVLLWRATPKN